MAERRERTDAEKAIEAIEVQERKIKRAEGRVTKARAAVRAAEQEVSPLRDRLEYLLKDPALPKDELDKRRGQAEAARG